MTSSSFVGCSTGKSAGRAPLGSDLGLVITTLFVVHPTPRLMALFVFAAQPLLLIVGVMYLGRVLQELREKDVF